MALQGTRQDIALRFFELVARHHGIDLGDDRFVHVYAIGADTDVNLGRRWADTSAMAITMQMRVGRVSLSAHAVIGLLGKFLTIAIVWIGPIKVFDGSLTLWQQQSAAHLTGGRS